MDYNYFGLLEEDLCLGFPVNWNTTADSSTLMPWVQEQSGLVLGYPDWLYPGHIGPSPMNPPPTQTTTPAHQPQSSYLFNSHTSNPEWNMTEAWTLSSEDHRSPKGQGRRIGLPGKTDLGPWVRVPRQKPTLLSADPTQPLLYCKFCQQPFSRRNSLRRHELLHSGHKPYHCSPCRRSFSRQDIFKRHCASTRCQRLCSKTKLKENH
ncbi:hypothetical protein DSO57_1023577 [Entomophthora muscae]|uniref:Uncharacterized protein n=1 Tax=Entomophthora muscae TaxID=34485 RepID=A0ACC2T331_9FUNG|nr:hypothetical protein DSO57_1023577 [Entomophthora muscae]